MPRPSRAGSRDMPASSLPTPASLKTAAKASTCSAICALPPTRAPCEAVTRIWPLSSGLMSEAESISTMRRRHPAWSSTRRVSPHALGVAIAGASGDQALAGFAAGHARGDAERSRHRVGVADHAAGHHVRSVADAAAGVGGRGGSHAQRLGHGDDGNPGLVLAHARIVVDDGAGMRLERKIGGIAPAVRAGDDDCASGLPAPAWLPCLRGRCLSAGRFEPCAVPCVGV